MPPTADGVPIFCAHDEVVPIGDVRPNPRNPNQHPAKQIALLSRIIEVQGWRAPITVSTRSGYVVRGHGRLAAAALLKKDSVPIDRQDYATEAAEWADMIADNRIAEFGIADTASLAELLAEVGAADFDLTLTGFDDQWLEDARQKIEMLTEETDYLALMGPALNREPAPRGTEGVTVTITGPATVLTAEATAELRRVWSAAGAKVTIA